MNRIYLLFIAFIAVHISAFGKDYSYIIVARNDTDSVYCAKHFRLYDFEKGHVLVGTTIPDELIKGKSRDLNEIYKDARTCFESSLGFEKGDTLPGCMIIDEMGHVRGAAVDSKWINNATKVNTVRNLIEEFAKEEYTPAIQRGRPVSYHIPFVFFKSFPSQEGLESCCNEERTRKKTKSFNSIKDKVQMTVEVSEDTLIIGDSIIFHITYSNVSDETLTLFKDAFISLTKKSEYFGHSNLLELTPPTTHPVEKIKLEKGCSYKQDIPVLVKEPFFSEGEMSITLSYIAYSRKKIDFLAFIIDSIFVKQPPVQADN